MSDIARRLYASLKYDVLNGDRSERAILGSQLREAVITLNQQATELAAIAASKENK